MTTHEQLVEGRNRLARGYLIKYRLVDNQGGFCARGAVMGGSYSGSGTQDEFFPTDAALAVALGAEHGVSHDEACYLVTDFNNAAGTTKADVLDLFDKAIAQTAPTPDVSFMDFAVLEVELEKAALARESAA